MDLMMNILTSLISQAAVLVAINELYRFDCAKSTI